MEQPPQSATASMKRESGQPSRAKNCAECRRLKIKCDRSIPCSNCVKRGTASICPDGKLMSKGHRLILSNTEDLHAKIEELTARIEELEEALATLQAEHSSDPHPLLSNSKDAPLVTSFGSLVIGDDGNSRFFGSTSSVEWVMMMDRAGNPDSANDDEQKPSSAMPDHPLKAVPDLALIGSSFPIPVLEEFVDVMELRRKVVAELPDRERASMLVDNYYSRAAWEIAPVLRTRFVSEYFAPCYADPENPPISAHELAFVYAVFGTGMLQSPEIPNCTAISRRYMSLSQACLAIDNPFGHVTITCIDTLLLHVVYIYMCDELHSPAKAWATLGVAMKLAQMLGLHREPSMWGLSSAEAARRRRTMWELVSCDLWAALIGGRPPMIARQHFDVQLPIEEPDITDPDPSFSLGKHHFSEACLWSVLDLGLASANKTTYAAVMKVDTKIRQWKLPKELVPQISEPLEEQRTVNNFRNATEMIFREITLMCLHRCYFGAALLEPQFDLLKNQYSRSVLAAYASSCAILGRVRALYKQEPIIIMKLSFFWTHAFSAAVILAAIVVRAPDCSLALTALDEFDLAVTMFIEAQHSGHRARRGLPILLRLQCSAHAATDAFKQGVWSRHNEADKAFLQSLGGIGAVTHRQQSPGHAAPPVVAMAPIIDSNHEALDEYLRAFDFHATHNNNMSAPPSIPTSDEFLQGVLTGDWGSLFAPPPTQPGYDNVGLGPRPSSSSIHDQFGLRPFTVPQPPSLYSEGDSSTNSTGAPAGPTSAINPPSVLYQGPQQQFYPAAHQDDELQRTFLWENFLHELGINNS